jgi:glycosyltransferase Alg8
MDQVKDNAVSRMAANLLRWSGNMLRNGQRVIALGPRKCGGFIWWCIVDQRIAMWTGLISPVLAIFFAIVGGWRVLLLYLAWVLFTRTFLCLMYSVFSGRISGWYPLLMYTNQVVNSMVKVYLLFRLPLQKWKNRGGQVAGSYASRRLQLFQHTMSWYLTLLYVSSFLFVIAVLTGVLRVPGLRELSELVNIFLS